MVKNTPGCEAQRTVPAGAVAGLRALVSSVQERKPEMSRHGLAVRCSAVQCSAVPHLVSFTLAWSRHVTSVSGEALLHVMRASSCRLSVPAHAPCRRSVSASAFLVASVCHEAAADVIIM
jgi:hypothetical protein